VLLQALLQLRALALGGQAALLLLPLLRLLLCATLPIPPQHS
jgi:hypothetical protein